MENGMHFVEILWQVRPKVKPDGIYLRKGGESIIDHAFSNVEYRLASIAHFPQRLGQRIVHSGHGNRFQLDGWHIRRLET